MQAIDLMQNISNYIYTSQTRITICMLLISVIFVVRKILIEKETIKYKNSQSKPMKDYLIGNEDIISNESPKEDSTC